MAAMAAILKSDKNSEVTSLLGSYVSFFTGLFRDDDENDND